MDAVQLNSVAVGFDRGGREFVGVQCLAGQFQRHHGGGRGESKGAPEAAGQPGDLVKHARKQAADQPSAGVGHVVEADVESDFVTVGVVENEVGMDGGVECKDRPKCGKTTDDYGGRVQPGRQPEWDRRCDCRQHERDGGSRATCRCPPAPPRSVPVLSPTTRSDDP